MALTCGNGFLPDDGLGHAAPPVATVGRVLPPRAPPGSWFLLVQGLGHAGYPYGFEPVGAARVDAPEHFDAVPGPGGDLGVGDAGVEPPGDSGVPEVIGAFHQR